MRRRHKRRGRLTKLLYVLVALFLLSLWNFYRNNPGIFYLHVSLIILSAVYIWLVLRSALKAYKKRGHMLWGSTRYTKSRVGQSSTLKRMRARLKVVKGYDVEVPMRVKRSLRKKV